jgi:hypothetical protein
LISNERRTIDDVPKWLKICAGYIHFQTVECGYGNIEDSKHMKEYIYPNSEVLNYLNVIFKKADLSTLEHQYQIKDYYMNL